MGRQVHHPTRRQELTDRAQRKRQLDWMAQLRAERSAPPHRREQDIVYLYATERTFDGIAQGELQDLGLKRELVIDTMVERTIAALSRTS